MNFVTPGATPWLRKTRETSPINQPTFGPFAGFRIAGDPIHIESIALRDINVGHREMDLTAAVNGQRMRQGCVRAYVAEEKSGSDQSSFPFPDEHVLRHIAIA